MKLYFTLYLSVVSLGARQDTPDLMVFLDAKLAKHSQSMSTLVDDPALVSQYETVRLLRAIQGQLHTLTEQQVQASVPYGTRVFNACKEYVHRARDTEPLRMIEQSHGLQAALAVVVSILSLNVHLLRLQRNYHAASGAAHKQAYKKSYQQWAGMIQKIVGIEKWFTVRLRDASIGFWGNGQFAKRLFNGICEWCSLRSLFYIDEQLASGGV